MPATAAPPPTRQPAADGDGGASLDKSGRRVRRMFGGIADRYDRMNHLLSGGVDYHWRRVTAGRADLGGSRCGGGPVLDLCTGTGDLAFAFRTRSPDTRVVGADFTIEMLRHGVRKSARRSAGVPFVAADALRLPFPDDAFAAVSVAFGLRNVADTDGGLREITRVLRPGGQALILEFSRPTNPLFAPVYRQYFRHVLPRIGRLLARNDEDAYDYLPSSVAEFPDGDTLCERLRAAGLTECRFTPLTLGIATLYEARVSGGSR